MKLVPTQRRLAVAAATTALAVTTAAPGALAPSYAAPAESCPAAYPVADLAVDQPVTGLTVSKGTTPDGFTGTVLGVLEDGIGADLDMIMVRLTSAEIDRVGGIWAGMSGSPVYAADGRLIGAVAYGLSFGPSPVAGVTPAEEMRKLLTSTPVTGAGATKVDIPPAIERKIVSNGDATAAEAEAGLSRLPVPVGVSGMFNSKRLTQFNKQFAANGMKVYRAGAAPSVPAPEVEIVAGGNLAGSLSYGDLSAVGTGTATMVCGDEVVGFGHPFNFSGESSLTMHGANAVYVQEDPTLVPFKVANPSGPVGVIDQDRLAGIKGVRGAAPASTLITTKVTLPSGKTRTGTTRASLADFVPTASAFALLTNEDRVFDRIGAGSSVVRYSVAGHTKAGTPFKLSRANRQDSPYDISYENIFELAGQVGAIIENEFTEVTITSVYVSVAVTEERRNRIAQKVQIWNGTTWKTLTDASIVRARPGGWVKLRTVLTTYRNVRPTKYVVQNIKLPSTLKPGAGGGLSVRAAAQGEEFVDEPTGDNSVTSFAKLIESLASAPRNDQMLTSIDIFNEGGDGGVPPECRGCRPAGAAAGEYHKEIVASIYEVVRGSHFFEMRIIK